MRRIVVASLRARGARLLLAVLAVTLGVGVAVALATLALQVGDDLARDLRTAGPNFVIVPEGATVPLDLGGSDYAPARAGTALDEGAIAATKTTFWKNNVLEAAPELTIAADVGGRRFPLTGTWFEHEVVTDEGPWRTGLATLRPRWRVAGRWPAAEGEIALGRRLAEDLGAAAGTRILLDVAGTRAEALVTGVVAAGGADDEAAWAPLPWVQTLAGRDGEVDRVWFSALVKPAPRTPEPDPVKDPDGFEAYMCTAYPGNIARDLTQHLAGARVRPLSETVAAEAQVVSRLNLLMLLLALAALTASVLGLVSTTTASVLERSREIGLLRAIGAGPAHISLLLLGESLIVALAGGALGFLAGSVGAAAIRGDVFGAGTAFHPLLLPVSLALAVAVGVLGTLGPLRVALRLDPATVLRG